MLLAPIDTDCPTTTKNHKKGWKKWDQGAPMAERGKVDTGKSVNAKTDNGRRTTTMEVWINRQNWRDLGKVASSVKTQGSKLDFMLLWQPWVKLRWPWALRGLHSFCCLNVRTSFCWWRRSREVCPVGLTCVLAKEERGEGKTTKIGLKERRCKPEAIWLRSPSPWVLQTSCVLYCHDFLNYLVVYFTTEFQDGTCT